ncbi:2-polyprenyl-6-methoxyphenol hydroxylase-like FAD-dependent oxidoreductase [Roseibium hamelinense]|uniref:2-polyprenyl-6-methoxyphenol hydroxylase-like FAD-dependent oxidoreductase n=2 Tax=Roseibium hamelinense TaxID=150831 RepID=A0A562TGS6_9HYPH|nr:2-polyprenyl-6-methoxyphenol hydroxylase-like FAD-dependent oxidoreductase [Roseibium hamelinense]
MAACMMLAEKNVPVIWIAPEGSSKPKPGESLASSAVPLLKTLGLACILEAPGHRKVEVLFSSWGTDQLVEQNRTGLAGDLGYVIDRSVFENHIYCAAVRRPEISRCFDTAVSLERSHDSWTVTTNSGSQFEGAFVIDGTGRHSAVGRKYTTLNRSDKLAAAYDFLIQVDQDIEPTPATLIEAVADGWWYATLLQDRRLAVNYYSDPDLMPKGLGHDVETWKRIIGQSRYISRWIDTGGFGVSRPPSLASAGTTYLSTAAGPGWAAVGDAAAAFDPLSSHGMTSALWTGIEGAKAAALWLDGTSDPLMQYQNRVAEGVSQYITGRAQIYGREHRFPGSAFWQRR